MKVQLNYKRKNKLLLIGIGLSILFIYTFAIKKTIILATETNTLEQKLESAKNAPQNILVLKKEISEMNEKIGATNTMVIKEQQPLLELITEYCKLNNVILREFPPAIEEENENFNIETNKMTFQSDFSHLLSLVHLVEQKKELGKVSSVEYAIKKDQKTKEMALIATIYLQNIRKHEN